MKQIKKQELHTVMTEMVSAVVAYREERASLMPEAKALREDFVSGDDCVQEASPTTQLERELVGP